MENHFSEPIASTFSDQSAQLSVRTDQNSIRRLHALDRTWSCTRALSLHLSGNAGTAWAKLSAWEKSPSNCRVLDLGRCVCDYRSPVYSLNPHGLECSPREPLGVRWRRHVLDRTNELV